MERTVRRSMRLAKNNRQKKRNRAAAKRLRSPIERNRGRMSVGEVMGLSPAASYAVNLSEARAMDNARAAAANAGAGRSRRRRARSKSAKGRAKANAHTREPRSAPANRRRSTLGSVALEKLTNDIFDDEVTSSGDDKPPPLDGTDSDGAAPGDPEETKEQEFAAADARLSVIETPASQRAQWSSDDEGFIKGSDETTSVDNADDDPDYELTPESASNEDSSKSEDEDDKSRLALVLRRSIEETVEDDARKPGDRIRVWPPCVAAGGRVPWRSANDGLHQAGP